MARILSSPPLPDAAEIEPSRSLEIQGQITLYRVRRLQRGHVDDNAASAHVEAREAEVDSGKMTGQEAVEVAELVGVSDDMVGAVQTA